MSAEIVGKEEIEKLTEKLKKLLDVNSEKKIAEEMEISPSQYSQMKSNGKFHYEKLIALMRRKNLSLDDFFGIKDDGSRENESKFKIPYFKNNKKYILLQDIDNSNDNLRIIKKNEQFIIFNTSVKQFQNDGIYVFMQNNFVIVRRINCNVNQNNPSQLELEFICIKEPSDIKIIDIDNLSKINFIGIVEHIIEKKDYIQ